MELRFIVVKSSILRRSVSEKRIFYSGKQLHCHCDCYNALRRRHAYTGRPTCNLIQAYLCFLSLWMSTHAMYYNTLYDYTWPAAVTNAYTTILWQLANLSNNRFIFPDKMDVILCENSSRLNDLLPGYSALWVSHCFNEQVITRKLCYRKDDRAMRLIYECPGSFW